MIEIIFKCSDCVAEAKGTEPLQERFRGINGLNYGFGKYVWDTPDKVAPEGWIASDMIGATYCPKCAKEIESHTQGAGVM